MWHLENWCSMYQKLRAYKITLFIFVWAINRGIAKINRWLPLYNLISIYLEFIPVYLNNIGLSCLSGALNFSSNLVMSSGMVMCSCWTMYWLFYLAFLYSFPIIAFWLGNYPMNYTVASEYRNFPFQSGVIFDKNSWLDMIASQLNYVLFL